MDSLAAELSRYMDESAARGNRVIAIDGVRAILKRHETSIKAPSGRFHTTDEYLQVKEASRLYGANKSVN